MRLIDFVFVLVIVTLIGLGMETSYLSALKTGDRLNLVMRKTQCIEYVSESFRKTCMQKDNESFLEWEEDVRLRWRLEEIRIEKKFNKKGEILYSCFWEGPWGQGVLYQRSEYEKETSLQRLR